MRTYRTALLAAAALLATAHPAAAQFGAPLPPAAMVNPLRAPTGTAPKAPMVMVFVLDNRRGAADPIEQQTERAMAGSPDLVIYIDAGNDRERVDRLFRAGLRVLHMPAATASGEFLQSLLGAVAYP